MLKRPPLGASWGSPKETNVSLKRMLLIGCLLGLGLLIGLRLGRLHQAARAPVEAVVVLGGSIQREIFVAQQRADGSTAPILISQGSADPCIVQIFQREAAPTAAVWLEKCAQSTFDNFRFSLPILKQWGARHVQVVTSGSHLPRAAWLGQIMLGSHGLWIEVVGIAEQGRPGNQESLLKTSLDLGRALLWAGLSQIYTGRCSDLMPLQAVDLLDWQQQGFECEHQGNLG